MRTLRAGVVVAGCAWMLGCGPAEPKSPLILAGGEHVTPGVQTLTSSQTQALQTLITGTGKSCEAIELAYLRDVDRVGGGESWQVRGESWEVRCSEAPYAVEIRSDGTPAAVIRCVAAPYRGPSPCMDMEPYRYSGRQRSGGSEQLNPDLKKLLQPMTVPDGKKD